MWTDNNDSWSEAWSTLACSGSSLERMHHMLQPRESLKLGRGERLDPVPACYSCFIIPRNPPTSLPNISFDRHEYKHDLERSCGACNREACFRGSTPQLIPMRRLGPPGISIFPSKHFIILRRLLGCLCRRPSSAPDRTGEWFEFRVPSETAPSRYHLGYQYCLQSISSACVLL